MKRIAQISIFVIVSVILVVFGIFFILNLNDGNLNLIKDVELNSKTDFNDEFTNIRENIQDCLNTNLKEGVYYVSLQGGYYYYDGSGAEYYDLYIPYYLENNFLEIPEIKTVEEQIQDYINYESYFCIEDFEYDLNQRGFNLSYDEINSKVIIENNIILAEIEFPIAIEYKDQLAQYKYFNLEYNYDFISKYAIVENYVKNHLSENYPGIPLGYLTRYAYENEFMYDYYAYDDNSIVYMFTFDDENNEPLVYSFVIKYDWGKGEE